MEIIDFKSSGKRMYDKAMYYYGIGDMENVLNCLIISANMGYLEAELELARAYSDGIVTKVDDKESFKYYLKSAEKGHPLAEFHVGNRYLTGNGVKKDFNESTKWFKLAKEHLNDEKYEKYEYLKETIDFCTQIALDSLYSKACSNEFNIIPFKCKTM